MLKQTLICVLVVVGMVNHAHAQNHRYQRRGAILGGLAGAAIGVAIGDKGNNETAGALIGGAVGAIAGGSIGNEKDHRIEHRRYHAPQYYPTPGSQQVYRSPSYPYEGHLHGVPVAPQPTWQTSRPAVQGGAFHGDFIAGPLSPLDVVSMVRHGIADSTIVDSLRNYGVTRPLSVRDIIGMHEQGVSENVIHAMQVAPVGHGQVVAPNAEFFPSPVSESYRVPTADGTTYGPSILESSRSQPALVPPQ
ncbi:glycine zipper domain-containing protein [Novipirellula artificiosorum]|uniref:Glycine zipper domain-containing protein n=1 Tax=Novipirellula artificiosorum TaxID=2528016 RepID=A0A5C6DZA2_9BACT|nr:glycine zipper domain-containing protein [Novipirellula artificiosorum]TWU40771.1 hypothetical protein Poly41_16060 [Novipirellula artificiosorum]